MLRMSVTEKFAHAEVGTDRHKTKISRPIEISRQKDCYPQNEIEIQRMASEQ